MFRLATLALVLAACTEDGPSQQQPPPIAFSQDALVPGAPATLSVVGASPGDTVYFGLSTAGTGSGRCIPSFGVCLGLLDPVSLLGTAVADGAGDAELTLQVPAGLPPQFVHTQAVLYGVAGGFATNTVSAPVLAGALDVDGDGYCGGAVCADPSSTPGDCNDDDADVYPGQRAWFDQPHVLADGSTSYDYDCDGGETQRWVDAYTCMPEDSGMAPGIPLYYCPTHDNGWARQRPARCGQTADWRTGCQTFPVTSTDGICLPQNTVSRTQMCR
jgi:hypothetical protein